VSRSRITYVGHATVLFELEGVRLLTDPVLTQRVAHIQRTVPVPDLAELRQLDAILVSHAHADHLHPASLRRLAAGCPAIAPPGCAATLRRAGLKTVDELEAGERRSIGPVGVEAVAAVHDGRRYPVGPESSALGYLLDGPARVYFAGDTDLFDGLGELAGRVDVALLPVWGWGPRVGPGHMDPELAAQAAALIRPAVAVPIHWGTLRSFNAPKTDPRAPAEAFAAAVGALGLDTDVSILAPGESMVLA